MSNVYLVKRVSTTHQDMSLEAQDVALRKWAEDHGHVILDQSIENGISGARNIKKRNIMGILDKMGKGDILCTYSWSRLTRSLSDLMEIAKILEKKGAHLVSLVEQIDTSTPSGRLFYHIMGSMAQFERELIAQRVQFGLNHKREKKEKLGGKTPYGFNVKEVSGTNRKGESILIKKLIINEKEKAVIESIRDMRTKKCTLWAIANTLNNNNIPTKNGSVWMPMQIHNILKRVEAA